MPLTGIVRGVLWHGPSIVDDIRSPTVTSGPRRVLPAARPSSRELAGRGVRGKTAE